MDQLKWSTPIKDENKCELMRSPIIYKTPVKQETPIASKYAAYQSNANCFGVLPSDITPPSGLTKFIARNPFETNLINRLHMSMISPTVFNKVSSPAQGSPGFAWTVDELAQLRPVKIEEFPTQQIDCTDPETEIKVQAAIDTFFETNQIIVSPWDIRRKENGVKIEVDTPTKPDNLNLDSSKSKKDGSSQTVLTFASELLLHAAEILSPYCTFTQDQNVENDDANSSNNSLRRKLFFDQDDCAENEEYNSACLSPVKMNESLMSPSPLRSGMLVHGTPLKHLPNADYDQNTSQTVLGSISPPNISPIHSTINNMSCESMKSRSRSIARLDFTTEMSIDYTHSQHKQCLENQFLDESHDKDNANKTDTSMTSDSDSNCVRNNNFTGAKIASRISTQFEIGFPDLNFKQESDIEALKHLTESCKMFANESCILQQTNGMLGTSDQQSASNFTQDTGYQTYSMSSMTNVMDSCMITPVKEKSCWGDRALSTDDAFRVSDWKENMRNVFSSTPSRSNRERENLIP